MRRLWRVIGDQARARERSLILGAIEHREDALNSEWTSREVTKNSRGNRRSAGASGESTPRTSTRREKYALMASALDDGAIKVYRHARQRVIKAASASERY